MNFLVSPNNLHKDKVQKYNGAASLWTSNGKESLMKQATSMRAFGPGIPDGMTLAQQLLTGLALVVAGGLRVWGRVLRVL